MYVRVRPGDIDGSGALLSGNSVTMNLSGDLNNQGGTIAGRTTVAITADNINNLGGRITGKDVAVIAGNDLNNIGGMIDAQHSLNVFAARNVNVITTTSDASSSAKTARGSIEQQRTVIDRVAGLYVSDPGGSLGVYASGNITTAGAQIVSGGSVEMRAKGDIKLDSVTTGQSESIHWSSRNSRIDGSSQETGTTVSGAGNVTIKADGDISTRAAQLSAGDVLSVDAGGKLRMVAGQNQTYAQTEYSQRSGMSYSRLEASSSQSTLARTTLDADKVKLHSGGDMTLGAIQVDADTLDIQSEGKLYLATQTTSSSKSRNESDGDAMFVNAATKGNIDETTNYNHFNVASVRMQANGGIEANVAKGTDLNTLAQQPGMGWVNQLVNNPALANSTQWKTVEEAHKKWQTDQSSLGPVSSALVMLVVAVATFGAGTAAAGTATTATSAGTGMAGAMGLTVGQTTILAGAMEAGITALAGQASVSFMNNGGNLAKVFDELGSSQSVKNLLTAMVTGGALAGLNLNPVTGQATANSGQQLFVDQLAQNVKGGVATALIRTAINGGNLEDALTDSLKTAFLNTIAAQTANEIGDLKLDSLANKLAHAIAGCAVGAASAGSGGGCAAGALGAAIGELTAETIGRSDTTVAVAALMSGLAVAVAGGDAAQVNLAASAGSNAAANNYLNHDQQVGFQQALKSCNGEATCISRETSKWEALERQQSADAANCKTVSECTEISRTARTGIGFTLADAQAMCGGVQGCVDFATDLGRRDVYDEVNARDVGYANALAARRAQLLAAGLDPDSATIGAGITPGDAASAAGSIAAASIGGIRSTTAVASLSLAPPPNTYSVSPRGVGSAQGPLPSGYTTVSRWVSPEEAALWVQNQGTAIPAAVPRNGTPQLYVTEAGAPYPAGANGTVRIDFAVPQGMLRPGNSSNNFMILQPSTSTPIYNVNIHVPNGQILPNLNK